MKQDAYRGQMIGLAERGAFILSIDLELAWGGVHDGSFRRRSRHYRQTREAIERLLAMLERYEIRATWAVIGHLFLRQCRMEGGVKHPEITRPSYTWFTGDWFDADPCSDLERDPFWYGPDLVERILNCKVPQEIGCHGFSHMIVGDSGCSPECFDSELKACLGQATQWGLTLKSFVFPRNSVGHLDVLARNGFVAFRSPAPSWYTDSPQPLRHVARLVESLLPVPPPVTGPRRETRLWDFPASYYYPHRVGWARMIPVSLSVYKATLGLERAASQRFTFHLWFHPFNLASDLDGLLRGLETIFDRARALQKAGRLTNPTMAEMAQLLHEAEQEG